MPEDTVEAYTDAYSNVVWQTWAWTPGEAAAAMTERPAVAGGIKFFVVSDSVYVPGVPYGISYLGPVVA